MTEKMVNRRIFLRSTLLSVTGLPLLTSSVLKQEEKVEEKGGKKRRFIYRTLGKTGIKLPVISMGTQMARDPALIRAALDSGINHLQTAQHHRSGKGEEMIGEAIKGRPRDSYFITTQMKGYSSVDISLKRLGLNHVDLLCLHNAPTGESILYESTLNAMQKAKKEGKARFVGVSVHQNEPEVIQACTESKFYDFVMTSYNFRQKHYVKVREAIAIAAQAGLGVITFKVMGGEYPVMTYSHINANAALKWVLQDPNVHSIVPGIASFDHIDTDLAVMEDLTLNDSEKDYLQKHASLPGLYCQGCEQCEKQCLAKLPIPDLMRAYMYSYGYRKPAMAQELILSLGLPSYVCEDCGPCPVKCMNGWNVQRKVRDIVRLRNVPLEFLA